MKITPQHLLLWALIFRLLSANPQTNSPCVLSSVFSRAKTAKRNTNVSTENELALKLFPKKRTLHPLSRNKNANAEAFALGNIYSLSLGCNKCCFKQWARLLDSQ